MKKFKIQSQSDVRYEKETVVTEEELIKLLEFNLIDFIKQNSIKDEESLFIVKDTIDSLEEFYQYKDKDINKVKYNLIDWFSYDVEEIAEETTKEEITNLVIILKNIESCNSYDEYYNSIENCYNIQFKAMENANISFKISQEIICEKIEADILTILKSEI